MKTSADFIKNDTAFFQDDNYYVKRTCSGEWGGSVWFKDKNTGIEYSCSGTCPVIINKVNDGYILTNSLAHLSGFSEIVKIANPASMKIFQLPKPRKKKRKVVYRNIGDNESKSRVGTELLVDTVGAIILITFPYKEKLYHIIQSSEKLYLSQLVNEKLVTIDTIYNNLSSFYKTRDGVIYSYSTNSFKTKDNHHIILFENSGLLGFLDIYENKIKLTRYK